MTLVSRRSAFVFALLAGLLPRAVALAADKPKEIRLDWATTIQCRGAQGEATAGEGVRQGRHFHRLGTDARLQQGA